MLAVLCALRIPLGLQRPVPLSIGHSFANGGNPGFSKGLYLARSMRTVTPMSRYLLRRSGS